MPMYSSGPDGHVIKCLLAYEDIRFGISRDVPGAAIIRISPERSDPGTAHQ